MSERQKVEDRLRRKEAEILGFEEKIRAARTYIQALRDVLKMMNEEGRPTEAASSASETPLRTGSAVARAREIILRRGAPVHINLLLAELGKEPTRENAASLIGSLSAYVRRSEIFTRPAPNTFGLLEMGHISGGDAQEPPQGFGQAVDPKSDDEDEIPI